MEYLQIYGGIEIIQEGVINGNQVVFLRPESWTIYLGDAKIYINENKRYQVMKKLS
jgi:intein-encoded DNA endonuclease-like protein